MNHWSIGMLILTIFGAAPSSTKLSDMIASSSKVDLEIILLGSSLCSPTHSKQAKTSPYLVVMTTLEFPSP